MRRACCLTPSPPPSGTEYDFDSRVVQEPCLRECLNEADIRLKVGLVGLLLLLFKHAHGTKVGRQSKRGAPLEPGANLYWIS